jgi:hypothetical protein
MVAKPANASTTTDETSLLAQFETNKAINNAPAWRPDSDDNDQPKTFMGEVIGLRMGGGDGKDDYGFYPVIVYKLSDGSAAAFGFPYLAFHAFHTLARQQLKDLGTTVGVKQIVSYDGLRRKNNATDEEIAKGMADYHVTYIENVGAETKAVADGFEF